MDYLSHQFPVRSHHKASHFRINCYISHSGRHQSLLIHFAYPFPDFTDVIPLLSRLIGDPHASRQINKPNVCPGFLLQPDCHLKQLLCQQWVILIGHCIAGKKSMDAEILHSFFFQHAESFKHLLRSETVFGIPRVIHDPVAHTEHPARIITAAHRFRQFSQDFLQKIYMRNII